MQLLYVTREKLESATVLLFKESVYYLATLPQKYKKLVEIDVNMNLKVTYY